MCEIDLDGEPVACMRSETRKARKTHRCDCCGGSIRPGDVYEFASWIFDHEPDSQKQCAACAADNKEFCAAHRTGLFADSFYVFLKECVFDPDAEDDEDTKRWRPMLERLEARREAARANEAPA